MGYDEKREVDRLNAEQKLTAPYTTALPCEKCGNVWFRRKYYTRSFMCMHMFNCDRCDDRIEYEDGCIECGKRQCIYSQCESCREPAQSLSYVPITCLPCVEKKRIRDETAMIEKLKREEAQMLDKIRREKEAEERRVKKKMELLEKWRNGDITYKLNLQTMDSLKTLARNKSYRGFTKRTREELIDALAWLTTDDDFPIREKIYHIR